MIMLKVGFGWKYKEVEYIDKRNICYCIGVWSIVLGVVCYFLEIIIRGESIYLFFV